MRILIVFNHGLGDAVQLTAVLRHLRHYHPDWQLDVAAWAGKHSAFGALADRVRILDRYDARRDEYDQVFDLAWHEADRTYAGHPATKERPINKFRKSPVLA